MIARHLTIVCLIYTALVLQPSVTSDLTVTTFRPWLPGLAVMACVLLTDGPASLVWAGLLGLAVDCQSSDRLGVNLVMATVVACGLMMARSDNRSFGLISVGVSVFGGTFLWRTAASIVHGLLDRQPLDVTQLARNGSFDAGCSCALAIGLLMCGRMLMNETRPQSASSVSLGNRWSMLTGK